MYTLQTYMGEGPKYTFSQKFNIDGTTDGTRHPKAPIVAPNPGPGTYEIKSELDSELKIGEINLTLEIDSNFLYSS